MTDLNPILLLPYRENELTRKRGGGRTPEPLVDVDDRFRADLTGQLLALAEEASAVRASASNPLPVRIRLRARALAKSNRPYAMLQGAALPPIGAARAGELIVAATPDRLRGLASTILTGRSATDRYNISTFAAFDSWSLVKDAFGVADEAAAEAVLERSRSKGSFLKVTFFPWLARTLQQIVSPQGAITEGGDRGNEVLEAFRMAVGLEVHTANMSPERPVAYVDAESVPGLDALRRIKSVRTVGVAAEYAPIDIAPLSFVSVRPVADEDFVPVAAEQPVVGVLDSGIDSALLSHGVTGREIFNAPTDSDKTHGTFVAGLIMSSASLNAGESGFPDDSCRVFDAEVLPRSPIPEPLLYQRITDTLDRARDIKVWNCSFGANPAGPIEYGTFAQDMDALSDELGVLFIQAAGNVSPPRPWPVDNPALHLDGLASPAEAVRSLTVGARAHKGGFVPVGSPSSYSRRGPNFALHVKPDVTHWAGDLSESGLLEGFGVLSVIPGDALAESVGTSFSTPIVSSIAANVWSKLEEAGATGVTPELVKGLVAHSAALRSPVVDEGSRHYLGWGTPPSSSEVLANDNAVFTTVNEVVITPGSDWYKRPYPVPAALLVNGKFRGEVILTLSYAPPINPAFGAEAVRYDVSGAFGAFGVGTDGKEHFNSITPQDQALWEADQINDGKWAPLKTYRKRSPIGIQGSEWALRLSLTERISEEVQREQRVYAIVSFRPIEPGVEIYQSGVEQVNRLQYQNSPLLASNRIRVEGS